MVTSNRNLTPSHHNPPSTLTSRSPSQAVLSCKASICKTAIPIFHTQHILSFPCTMDPRITMTWAIFYPSIRLCERKLDSGGKTNGIDLHPSKFSLLYLTSKCFHTKDIHIKPLCDRQKQIMTLPYPTTGTCCVP